MSWERAGRVIVVVATLVCASPPIRAQPQVIDLFKKTAQRMIEEIAVDEMKKACVADDHAELYSDFVGMLGDFVVDAISGPDRSKVSESVDLEVVSSSSEFIRDPAGISDDLAIGRLSQVDGSAEQGAARAIEDPVVDGRLHWWNLTLPHLVVGFSKDPLQTMRADFRTRLTGGRCWT